MQAISTLLERVASSHPRSTAVAGCLLCTGTYVGLLYVWRGLPRNHPSSIKRRMVSVGAASSIAWVPLYLALPPGAKLHKALGLTTNGLPSNAALPLALTATFFAGPLIFRLLDPETHQALRAAGRATWQLLSSLLTGQWQKALQQLQGVVADDTLATWRNLVVAPVTEEFVFRACMAPLLRLQGFSFVTTVFVTPLFFGAAHLHHLFDLVHHQKVPLARAATQVTFQFTYTTVFGWYETLLFLRTKTLIAPVLVHAFCNWIGVPDFPQMSRQARGSVALPLAVTAAGVIGFAILFPSTMLSLSAAVSSAAPAAVATAVSSEYAELATLLFS